uniref:RNA annealing protein n=1 Tax=Mycena chlorophos TaxID=658473 RepID=A0ABQ0LJF9_MYCCL|nr:RNA annealing protein [Mycena chlorophos]
MNRPQRLNAYHGPKNNITGTRVHVQPAWRNNPGVNGVNGLQAGQIRPPREGGSKILLSMLPNDVGEKEIEELFRKTIGPVRDLFLIYNSQANSKGMAVVTFQRLGDAVAARERFNGRVVDGRKPIRIQLIVDETAPEPRARAMTLFDRLQGPNQTTPVAGPSKVAFAVAPTHQNRSQPHAPPRPATPYNNTFPKPQFVAGGGGANAALQRKRVKKGPKRLKKQWAATNAAAAAATIQPFNFAGARKSKTVEELDREMEDYRAQGALED